MIDDFPIISNIKQNMVKYKYFGDKNRKLALSRHLAQCGKRSDCLCVGFGRIGKVWEILGVYSR